MDELEKIIQERYPLLPEDIQTYLISSDLFTDIKLISKNNDLNDEQRENLTTELILALLGVQSPDDFNANIKNALTLDDGKTARVNDEVNEKIFKPLQNSLKEIFEGDDSDANPYQTSDQPTDQTTEHGHQSQWTPHDPETRTDHILPEESDEKLISDGKIPQLVASNPSSNPSIDQQILSSQPLRQASLTPRKPSQIFQREYPPLSAPIPPQTAAVSAYHTLEKDIDELASDKKKAQSLAEQKLHSITSMPKQETKFEIPDPKNRTFDPYREPME
jgi:hypothetical protein